ncbi:DUF397 domain-containing protein [Actinosynnema sp. NPDC047251]|uniref:DUF397 domain-containing protein n=1 Tax=Saccharothrix espanaensis (strain ATCC 51144 / DSM 44229 / JCM 9112 / NBRC 15066 / NRRL 15764) TaxID=1179773 RepID=K0JSU7_SACES|nr:DUF397 domain-containing protein [Saccharothrix espanaensis]CCH28577.1 hypothetical protein BN6_12510 [Saccharothrix espanaensis DSM 44229]
MSDWRKSSYSGSGGTGGGNCVEITLRGNGFLVRDSKNPDGGTVPVTRAWLDSLKAR